MSVDGGIFFSEIFSAAKQSVNRKCYSMIFYVADKTELNMKKAKRQARIDRLVKGMLDKGILNDQFLLVQATRAAGNLQLVAKMIHLYCTEIEKDLRAFANYLRQPKVDYARASVRAGHLGLRSCCIGVQSIQLACRTFMLACVDISKERCMVVLSIMHREYNRLRTKFMAVLQLEVQIFLRGQHS